jgi:radical SAM superfamily enzyme YgiQ (UPF0313 family)
MHPEIGPAYREVFTLTSGLVLARKPHLLSLLDPQGDAIHLDLEGRLHRAWLDGRSYERGLDGRVRRVEIQRVGPLRSLDIDLLERNEADGIFGRVSEAVGAAARELTAPSAPPSLTEPLARAALWDPARYRLEESRFLAVYDPIPILPPDQNRALVVQITSGCAWNRCTFCHLYRDATFSLKSAPALRDHLRGVLEITGRALPLRRGIFLGQANALCVAQSKLLPLIDLVRDEVISSVDGLVAPAGFAAFIDAFSARKTTDELRELKERGLGGVSLGLESGSAEVLKGLGKPSEAEAAVALANDLHRAGIRLGIIVLVGAGGRRLAGPHVAETLEIVAAMSPGPKDRVYLSPLVVHAGSAYAERAGELGQLDAGELIDQAHALRGGLRQAGVRAPIALYDIRRFIY